MTAYPVYSLNAAIAEFFTQASTTPKACDIKAKELVGGEAVPVTVQGNCSYTVYAGPDLQYVVQFRLESLMLKPEIKSLAEKIYGSLVPKTSLKGKLGGDEKEPLYIYVMNRLPGISHLDFTLSSVFLESPESHPVWRKTLVSDIARFFALSWKAPQQVDSDYRAELRQTYTQDLQLLSNSLPSRLQPAIQKCLNSMDAIFSLPMVLLHRDFSKCNIMVDKTSCHLTGVSDWAEAEIGPFGQNLDSLEDYTGTLHLKNGWRRYNNYKALQDTFWSTFQEEVGGLSAETVGIIKVARTMGLLRCRGFTIRLANKPRPVPISDDEVGRYNMLFLDGFLVDPATQFDASY